MIFVKSAQADRVTVEVKFKVNGKKWNLKKKNKILSSKITLIVLLFNRIIQILRNNHESILSIQILLFVLLFKLLL